MELLGDTDQLCGICDRINLDEAFNPAHFDNLPPFDSTDAAPWSSYLRILRQFSLESIVEGGRFCALCAMLRKVALRIQHFSIPRAHELVTLPSAPTTPDGNDFVLASIPAHLVYRLPNSEKASVEHCRPETVFLVVVRGENTFERLAAETWAGLWRPTKNVIDMTVHWAKDKGSLISLATDEVCTTSSPIQYRIAKPHKLDYEQIKSWINLCTDSHSACKGNPKPPVIAMKLIDCKSRTIVKAQPGMVYAALSYVWGKGPPGKYIYPSLPDDLPHVIEDAMTVTKRLDIPYLWVDRYCIWQQDTVHKIGQINSMDQIYGDALITIVAAAGSDPSYGLPGVGGGRSHLPQITTRIGDKTLITDFGYREQRGKLERSKWYTRGWTYQEWALSTRVLLFTDYRVSFQCVDMECIEHFSHPVSIQDSFRQSTDHTRLHIPEGIKDLVREYSRRQLTSETDGLNAITGVLKAWSAASTTQAHVMGVPVLLPSPDLQTPASVFLALWEGLVWVLDFSGLRGGSRRAGFPSWSWVNIRGVVDLLKSDLLRPHSRKQRQATIDGAASVELQGGAIVNFDQYVNSGAMLSAFGADIAALHIHGWCFKVGPFCEKKLGTVNVFCLDLESMDTGSHLAFFPDLGINARGDVSQGKFEAISPYSVDDSRVALVFERTSEGARRIGVLQLQVWQLDGRGGRSPVRLCDPVQTFQAEKETIRLI